MLHIGTSGWQYRHWRGLFYPSKLPQSLWLEYYANSFQTVEVNNTFYNLPERSVFEQWRDRTPRDFVFTLKMSRYLTHIKRLSDPAEPVARFLERALGLGGKRGPILIQLPPSLSIDTGLLDATLAAIGPTERTAVEFRHESWFTAETRRVLERRQAALCLADSPRRRQPCWRTADWGLVRFHEGKGRQAPGYETAALSLWARQVAEMWGPGDDVFVYFNNDAGGYAIRDAATFAELASHVGLKPTRVPSVAAA